MTAVADDLIQSTLLGEAFEHAPAAIFVKEESGRSVAVNQAACTLTQYTRAELLALPPEQLSGRDPAELAANLDEFARSGRLPGRTPLRRKDGSTIDVDYRWFSTTVGGIQFFVFFITPAGEPIFTDA